MTEKDTVHDQNLPITKIESENLQLIAIHFTNGFFVSISEKDSLNLGTTAISLPTASVQQGSGTGFDKITQPRIDRRELMSATVIGSRNELYAKALAEKIVVGQGKMVYLSVYFQENNEDLFLESIKLIEQLLSKIST